MPQPPPPSDLDPNAKKPRLPFSAATVAVSGILLGGWNVIGFCWSILQHISPASRAAQVDPMVAVQTSNTFLFVWFWLSTSLNAAMSIAVLVGSYAVFRAKESGRKLLLVYAVVNLIYAIPDFIVTKLVIWPRQEPLVKANYLGDRGITQLMDAIANATMWGEFAFTLIWIGTILWVMTRAKVKRYFAAAALDNAVLARPINPYF